jgi:hypothetical protein
MSFNDILKFYFNSSSAFVISQALMKQIKSEINASSITKKMRITLSNENVTEYDDTNSITKEIKFYKASNVTKSKRGLMDIYFDKFQEEIDKKNNLPTTSDEILSFRKEKKININSSWVGSQMKFVSYNANDEDRSYSSIYVRIMAKKVAKWTGMLVSNQSYINLDKKNDTINGEITTKLLNKTVYHKSISSSKYETNKRLFEATFIDKTANFTIWVIPVGLGVIVDGHLDLDSAIEILPAKEVDFQAIPSIGSDVEVRAFVGGSVDLKIGTLKVEAGVKGSLEPFVEFGVPVDITNRFDDGLKASIKIDREIKTLDGSVKAYVDGKIESCCCGGCLSEEIYKSKKITSWDGYHKKENIFNKSNF